MFQLAFTLPAEKDLTISVKDYDLLTSDDVIGETKIDLENRYLTKFRATCGLPQSYCVSGPNQWRDSQTPLQLLETFCDKNRLPKPVFDDHHPNYNCLTLLLGQRLFVLDDFEKGIAANPHFGPAKQRLCLHALGCLPLVKEHVETRKLASPLQPGIEQGRLEMWIDIFPKSLGLPGPPFDISPRKPKEFELRVIVWNTSDVILDEESITGEKMSDIYVKVSFPTLLKCLFCTIFYVIIP
ncbi:unnamed protein product [Protopolystoma xenopodis]|uniref:Uncharacterized protein n=1 Tax=Protopolystoma xenopodis TaxID=117903 RepID=A0A448WFR1_9PLAT|nr:unnamed protein product [Protopolystoma xenopodis]